MGVLLSPLFSKFPETLFPIGILFQPIVFHFLVQQAALHQLPRINACRTSKVWYFTGQFLASGSSDPAWSILGTTGLLPFWIHSPNNNKHKSCHDLRRMLLTDSFCARIHNLTNLFLTGLASTRILKQQPTWLENIGPESLRKVQ